MDALALVCAAGQIGAAFAVFAGAFTAIGQGNIAAKAIESIARQPEAKGSITGTMFISLGISETVAIYGLLIAVVLLFANPLINKFADLAGLAR